MSKNIERKFKKDDFYGWRHPAQNVADNYLAACREAVADKNRFQSFKSNGSYRSILEHVSRDLGEKYLNNIKENNPKLLNLIEKFIMANDQIGSPNTCFYKDFSKLRMSPTTARYMKVLSDLELLFKDLNNLTIVEIGGGYGGLATVISQKYSPKAYYNVDLAEPASLSRMYCEAAGLAGFKAITPDQVSNELGGLKIDLCISNYAFSECGQDTKEFYIENILSKSSRGYITHNSTKERIEKTKIKIKDYNNFKIFDFDLCQKRHPIFTWENNE